MWFFALVIVLLIGAVAVVASGRWGSMNEVYDDRPDMTVPARHPLTSDDIQSSRFAIGVRGYRMDEVDTLLDRVAHEVAERDRRIADLERAAQPIVQSPPAPAPEPEPAGQHRKDVPEDTGEIPVPDPADDAETGWFRVEDENADRPV